MNKGTAIYEGTKVWFSDTIVFNGKVDYLIAFNDGTSVARWVGQSELECIVYHLDAYRA
jgi:hypothetical protein